MAKEDKSEWRWTPFFVGWLAAGVVSTFSFMIWRSQVLEALALQQSTTPTSAPGGGFDEGDS